ncbi:MAG: NADH-quinone oxidoreductase subunit N [Anaerolineae bacterium]|nr:NADH-quinone oxidoreductase subunit N [Phycisphaerae bacterium]
MNFLLAAIDKPFIPGWAAPGTGMRPFAAELVLIGTIIAVLLAPFFSKKSNILCAAISIVGLLIALAFEIFVGTGGQPGEYFRGLLVADSFSQLWKILLFIFTIGVIVMWFCTTASSMHEGDGPEFFTLLLAATLGMAIMSSTANLLMLFMAVEMASLPSYVLAGFRKTNRIGAEASLKYVLFGAATSAIMVYGLSILYGLYGTLQVDELGRLMATSTLGVGGSALLAVALAGLIVGIGFKVSAVPFHFWCPDVFEGASIDVSAFLSVASKGAALALLLRVLMTFAAGAGYHDAPGISMNALAIVIGVIGAITATVGNTSAFVQTNIKRLLAYSSIAHAGYMLCALSLLVRGAKAQADFDPTGEAARAILIYLAIYMFMNLGAFTVAGLIWRETGSEKIEDYAGMGRRSPILALCMTIFMFSLVGLPPLAGFTAKVYVLWALIQNGGWWWALVAVIGINTILSLYYYVRVVKVMYLNQSDRPAFMPNPIGLGVSVLCALMLFLMFIGFGPLNRLARTHSDVYLGDDVAARNVVTPLKTASVELP